MKRLINILSGICVFLFSGCNFVEKIEQKINMDRTPDVKDDIELQAITENDMNKLKEMVILFAHQSVGMNIVEGLENIGDQDPKYALDIKLIENPEEISEPGFYHYVVGKNHQPMTKLDHFKSFLEINSKADIAFMKFCYVDIKDTTDVNSLLANYMSTMDSLENEYENTFFIYVSCPYRSEEDTFNANRNEFNQLLRKNVAEKDKRFFDLARIESTKENGDRSSYELKGNIYHRMNRPYTKDSGHLNAYGSYLVAKSLLQSLINIEKK